MATYYENVAALSPKVWFKFNETTGTPVNSGSATCNLSTVGFGSSLLIGQAGVVDKSIRFVGEKYYTFSQLSNVMSDKSFSIEFWHKSYSAGGPNQYLFTNVTGVSTNAIAVQWNGASSSTYASKYTLDFRGGTSAGGGTYYQLVPSTTFTDLQWHHIVVTFSTTEVILYVDGVNVASQSNPVFGSDTNFDSAQTRQFGSAISAYMDEFAIYGNTLTAQQVLDNYNSAFNSINLAPVLTASALAVNPALSINLNLAATPATASAASGDHYNSTRDNFTLLDNYMSTLTLEQWYKFDAKKSITNYGTGGNVAYLYPGASRNDITDGIQGSGALRITGAAESVYSFSSAAATTEFTDDDFSLGFWTKKTTNEYANIFLACNVDVTKYLVVEWIDTGCIRVNARFNGSNNMITSSTDYTDGNWHYVAVRKSGNTMQMWVDNTSIGTVNVTQSMSDFVTTQFGGGGAGPTELMYVSQFYIGTSTNITSTQIANIYSYGTPILQAAAAMPDPVFSRNDSFNNYVEAKSPKFYFKMDEATGAPVNTGSSTLALTKQGTNATQNIASPVYKSYNFTNRDTQFVGSWSETAGTFSTNNKQTLVVYAKFASAGINGVAGTAAFGGTSGTGMFLQQQANGTMRLRSSNGTTTEDATSTANYADNAYHMFVGVKDGSNLVLYVDGVQAAINTSATHTFTDSGQFTIGGVPNTAPSAATRNLTVDEVAVFNTAFTAQQALEIFQAVDLDMDWTATALLPMPAVAAGFGPTIAQPVMTASAFLPNVFVPITPARGTGLFQHPNFEAIDNVNNIADVMTAAAQGENPGFDIGENNLALHMDASALFSQPQLLIPGFWFDNPKIATALMVQPTVVTTLGALIKPQSLNATAFLPLPPAYYSILDDKWYQRLLDVDYQSPKYGGIITFFNTSNSIYLNGGYEDWTAHSNRNPLNANYGYNLYDTPLPVAAAGYVDPLNRKALKLRNIALEAGDNETYSDGWTMEAMIQTTKKNQFIAAGRYRGNPASSVSRSYRTGIRLKDGKIAFTDVKDSTLGFFTSTDSIAFTGFKDIADGEWHHIIIQYRPSGIDQYAPRTQVWIDGKLDIQRYGGRLYYPGQIGYNSNDVNVYSDFNISAISLNKESFVLQRETYINYLAAFGISPIEAAPATASVELTTGTRGKGNRARALMLYFWPTWNAENGYYVGDYPSPFTSLGYNTSSGHDVGNESFDYDTFYGLTTYLTDTTQTFFDWDVFPLPVMNFYTGDTYRGDSNPLLNKDVTIASGTTRGTTYVDPVTNNYRYVNLMKDVYELDQYDAIFFRNYPDQSSEQDAIGLNSKTEVDEYFNLQEKTLFAEFLDNLREAIDTYNISLFVTNPQLAKDLGIIANVTDVPLLRDQGLFFEDEYSDNRAPVVTGRANVDGTARDVVNQFGAGWIDTWFNDRHRVINTLEYLTDDNTFIWTDYAFYQNADEVQYGGPDKLYKRYENRPYGLQIDDEFVFADSGNPRFRMPYQAVKPSDILAGIPITALSKKIWNQNYATYTQVDNPYKDYVTTIALPPGTNLKGKITTSKIFVSFSENVSNTHTYANPQFKADYVEYHQYDMASNYWVDIAFNAGIIDAATRAQYKAGTASQPALYDDNDSIKQYWSLSGDNIVSRIVPVTQSLKGFVGGDVAALLAPPPSRSRTRASLNGLLNSTRLRDALGRFASGGGSSSATGGNLQTFKIQQGRTYDTGTVFTPSINTRGLWWLSDKIRLTGKVVGGPAMIGAGQLPYPVVTADRPNTIIVQSMIATATINETQFRGADRRISVLPMYASATIIGLGGKNVLAGIGATAIAAINSAFAITQGPDQVIMYLHHVDPILYLRKEIIR